MAITIKPLTPAFGAEIQGVDLSRLTTVEFDDIFRTFTDRSVIFFRDQPELDVDQHMMLAQRFGEIHVHPSLRGRDLPHPGVVRIRTNQDSRVAAGNRWHSDVSCDECPPQASILQLHRIPPIGGDTLFSSLAAAYDALSDRMKGMLDGLTARHSGEEPFRHLFRFTSSEPGGSWPEHDHPVVRKHVDAGRPVLYVDREFTTRINELPKEEGKALLEFLFDHTERVDFQCRFQWSPNALAIWDNRAVLHHALWDYWPLEREGRRISVVGEKPIAWRLGQDTVSAQSRGTVRLTA